MDNPKVRGNEIHHVSLAGGTVSLAKGQAQQNRQSTGVTNAKCYSQQNLLLKTRDCEEFSNPRQRCRMYYLLGEDSLVGLTSPLSILKCQ
jgi:hypothetical protein